MDIKMENFYKKIVLSGMLLFLLFTSEIAWGLAPKSDLKEIDKGVAKIVNDAFVKIHEHEDYKIVDEEVKKQEIEEVIRILKSDKILTKDEEGCLNSIMEFIGDDKIEKVDSFKVYINAKIRDSNFKFSCFKFSLLLQDNLFEIGLFLSLEELNKFSLVNKQFHLVAERIWEEYFNNLKKSYNNLSIDINTKDEGFVGKSIKQKIFIVINKIARLNQTWTEIDHALLSAKVPKFLSEIIRHIIFLRGKDSLINPDINILLLLLNNKKYDNIKTSINDVLNKWIRNNNNLFKSKSKYVKVIKNILNNKNVEIKFFSNLIGILIKESEIKFVINLLKENNGNQKKIEEILNGMNVDFKYYENAVPDLIGMLEKEQNEKIRNCIIKICRYIAPELFDSDDVARIKKILNDKKVELYNVRYLVEILIKKRESEFVINLLKENNGNQKKIEALLEGMDVDLKYYDKKVVKDIIGMFVQKKDNAIDCWKAIVFNLGCLAPELFDTDDVARIKNILNDKKTELYNVRYLVKILIKKRESEFVINLLEENTDNNQKIESILKGMDVDLQYYDKKVVKYIIGMLEQKKHNAIGCWTAIGCLAPELFDSDDVASIKNILKNTKENYVGYLVKILMKKRESEFVINLLEENIDNNQKIESILEGMDVNVKYYDKKVVKYIIGMFVQEKYNAISSFINIVLNLSCVAPKLFDSDDVERIKKILNDKKVGLYNVRYLVAILIKKREIKFVINLLKENNGNNQKREAILKGMDVDLKYYDKNAVKELFSMFLVKAYSDIHERLIRIFSKFMDFDYKEITEMEEGPSEIMRKIAARIRVYKIIAKAIGMYKEEKNAIEYAINNTLNEANSNTCLKIQEYLNVISENFIETKDKKTIEFVIEYIIELKKECKDQIDLTQIFGELLKTVTQEQRKLIPEGNSINRFFFKDKKFEYEMYKSIMKIIKSSEKDIIVEKYLKDLLIVMA